MTNVSVYIYIDKHNTTWKVLCTVFTHSFLYQELTRLLRSLVPFLIRQLFLPKRTVRSHFPRSIQYIYRTTSSSILDIV